MPTATTNPPTPAAAAPPQTSTTSSPSTLPLAATFDFLPPLHALLNRLLLPPAHHSNNNGDQSTTPQIQPTNQSEAQPLSPKDLAIAASAITAKIQKARVAVRRMEGVQMGLRDQEEIIKELEEEAERRRGVLDGLRGNCARVAAGEGGGEDGG